ncbi:MAG: DMT family protein [Alphaproteobacteria bacterium]
MSVYLMSPYLTPILLLCASNIFMACAWYGHLRFTQSNLMLAIVVSWGIAFFEYCLQVPANRFGHRVYSVAELRTIQEVINLTVVYIFSLIVLKEQFEWNNLIGFAVMAFGAFLIFNPIKLSGFPRII